MKVLVLNAGSSSLKFDVWETEPEKLELRDTVERVTNMADALQQAFAKLGSIPIGAVGHRVVHGGERFQESVVITPEVERAVEELSSLAPLHNPHNLEAIRAARARLPGVLQIAAFDTAFHHTLPPYAYAYALPFEYLETRKIRRYGFHGISHRYIARRFAELRGQTPAAFRIISCHLGNGCSVCAIDRGISVDTSMGFTPLEGLVMGTRSGDLDAGAVLHLITHEHESAEDLNHILNSDSGIKGLSGISNDMRDVQKAAASGDERAALAVDVFCYRVSKYIASYFAALNGADAVVFTGGIGENAAEIRARICARLSALGIALDPVRNNAASREDRQIGASAVSVWVIPAQEELTIARDAKRLASME